MTTGHNAIAAALDDDFERPQLLLPFPEEKTIDMRRCCSILHASHTVVQRLRFTPLKRGSDVPCLLGYNTMRNAPLRIDYTSLVQFLDHLREVHGIPERRAPITFGRRRDEDLLPFPWSDTMTVEEAADVLGVVPNSVRLRIEAGQFEAYQLLSGSPWRISRSSLAKLVASFNPMKSSLTI